ncbi:MAG: hypothetical protein ACFFBD_30465, partial [Candidatus Hodarchaeota archaeon]
SLFAQGMNYIQIILAGAFVDVIEVNVLFFWTTLGTLLSLFSVSLNSLLTPRICNIRKSDPKLSIDFIEEISRAIAFITFPVFGILVIVIAGLPEVVNVVLLNKFNIWKYGMVAILAIAPYVFNIVITPRVALVASSDSAIKFNGIISITGSVTTVLIWIFSIQNYGIYSIVLGSFIGTGIILILFAVVTWKEFEIKTRKYLSFFFLELIGSIFSLILLNFVHPLIIIALWIILHLFIVKRGAFLLYFSLTNPKANI